MQVNRTDQSKNARKVKRPPLSQIHTVDEVRYWLTEIEREIQTTLAQTKSVRYTDQKVASMYERISQLEFDHKQFRQKIAQLEFGPNVHVLTKTIPVRKSIDVYQRKSTEPDKETIDELFAKQSTLPLLAMESYEPVNSTACCSLAGVNDQPLDFKTKSLVDYSDSDE